MACIHEPGTPGGPPILTRPTCRAPASILPSSPQLGSGTEGRGRQGKGKAERHPWKDGSAGIHAHDTKKRGEGRAERNHNWMRGTRIGEASNPGPVQGRERGKGEQPRPSCRFGGRCKYPYCPFAHPGQWTKIQRQPENRNQKEGSNRRTPRRAWPTWPRVPVSVLPLPTPGEQTGAGRKGKDAPAPEATASTHRRLPAGEDTEGGVLVWGRVQVLILSVRSPADQRMGTTPGKKQHRKRSTTMGRARRGPRARSSKRKSSSIARNQLGAERLPWERKGGPGGLR